MLRLIKAGREVETYSRATHKYVTGHFLFKLFIEIPRGGTGTHSNYISAENKISQHTDRKSESLID